MNFEAVGYECCYPHGREKAEAETALAAFPGLGNVDEWVGGIPKDLRRIEWLGVGWTVSAQCRPGEF